MAKKKASKMSGLGSYPIAIRPGEFLETTNIVPEMSPISASDAMKYQNFNSGNYYLNSMNDDFVKAGFDPYKQSVASAIASNPISNAVSQPTLASGLGNVDNPAITVGGQGQQAQSGFGSYLGDAWSGVKDAGKSTWDFLTPTKAADTHAQYVTDWQNGIGKDYVAPTIDNGIMTKAGSGTSLDDYIKQTQAQQGINNQQWATGMQAGLGAVNGVLGAMSYFDNKAMNKKNMALIDQQIANNQDVMKTRTERAGDIKKYFG